MRRAAAAWLGVIACASQSPTTGPLAEPEVLSADKAPQAIPIDELVFGNSDRFELGAYVGPAPKHPAPAMVISFAASWCEPCLAELPELGALASARTTIPFVIVGLDRDLPGQRALEAAVRPYPLILLSDADNSSADAYGVDALPTVLLLDRLGRVRYVHFGADPRAIRSLDRALELVLLGP